MGQHQRISAAVVEKRHARQRRLREVTDWVDDEGMVNILSRLDPINGARALAALREFANQIGPDDSRTAKQRRADAMVALLTGARATRSGKPHPKHMVHLLHCLETGQHRTSRRQPRTRRGTHRTRPHRRSRRSNLRMATDGRCGSGDQLVWPVAISGSPLSPSIAAAANAEHQRTAPKPTTLREWARRRTNRHRQPRTTLLELPRAKTPRPTRRPRN